MNYKPKNTTFLTPAGRAEIYFQLANLTHYVDSYIADLPSAQKPNGGDHHVAIKDLLKRLKGNALIQPARDAGAKNKYFALSKVDNRYYLTFFYLSYRDDCDTLFASIITCYATNNKQVHQQYESWFADFKANL